MCTGLSVTDPIPVQVIIAGQLSSIVYFSQRDCVSQPCLDWVFCIDTTGSMGDDIDQVKVSTVEINAELFSDDTTDTRVAVVNYRDFASRTGYYDDYPYPTHSKLLY